MSVLDPTRLIEASGALILVLGLLTLVGLALRLWRGRRGMLPTARLALVESLAVDARHRIVRVRDGETEHLLLIGPQTSLSLDRQPARQGEVS